MTHRRRAGVGRALLAFITILFVGGAGTPDVHGLQVRGLKNPQSFLFDPSSQTYFISNMDGEPTEKDNNGFITKLDKDGAVTDLRFIQGGQGGAVLHAPKGLAVVGDRLYVTDIDTLRSFDTATGRSVGAVPIATHRAGAPTTGLVDVVHDGRGVLYVSDAETNSIYRVDAGNGHAVSVFVRDDVLDGPRGLAMNPRSGHLVAVSWNQGSILDIDMNGQVHVLVSNSFFSWRFKNLDGVDFDTWGSMYVSDFTAGKVWRVTPDHNFKVIAEYLPTPADIGIDKRNHLILVPYVYGDAAEINGLEAPVQANQKKRKRTLQDYGFPFMKPEPAPDDSPDE